MEVALKLVTTFAQAKAVFQRAAIMRKDALTNLALSEMLFFASNFSEAKEVAKESMLNNKEIFKRALEKMIEYADTVGNWKDIYDMSNNYPDNQMMAFDKMQQKATSFSELKDLHSVATVRVAGRDIINRILERMAEALLDESENEKDQEEK